MAKKKTETPQLKEYKSGTTFTGVIGRTYDSSSPAWPEPNRSKPGAPNVLFIVLDDTGFGHLGCYGSPIKTPNIDSLAKNGLLYNNMHTTALCSPTRSCILTGRNHHSNHVGCLTNGSTGFPGYDGYMPFENGMLSEILKDKGYNTYCVGKWHLAPEETMSAAGPYDRWPLGRGFERYYGFLGGDTHQYFPELHRDNTQTEPEKTPEEGYHFTEDIVEQAKAMIADSKQIAPDKPFFMYFAPGAMHSPHHVRKEWADKYKGKFDKGWDAYRKEVFEKQKKMGIIPKNTVLSERNADVQDWEKLSKEEKKVYARMMEVFAGFLEHTDHYLGELMDFLKEMKQFDNTLIMLISDNGSSAEGGPTGTVNECRFFNNLPDNIEELVEKLDELGGPTTFNHFPWGWTYAGNTPFRRWKRETYRGGTSDPFLIHWPKGIKSKGQVRSAYTHAIDMVPTVLDAIGIEPPQSIRGISQSPIEGVSLVSTFDDPKDAGKHVTQYFEMIGHRSIYNDGWRAVCPWPGASYTESGRGFGTPIDGATLTKLDATGWELYNLREDFAETNNLAKVEKDKLIEMIGLWYNEAGKYNVLPIDGRSTQRIAEQRPQISLPKNRYVLYNHTQAIPANAAPRILNRHYSISAEVVIPKGGAEGVMLSMGGNDGGITFYIQDGKLCYSHNYVTIDYFHVKSDAKVPEGKHFLSVEFTPTGKGDIPKGKGTPGNVELFIDGKSAGKAKWPVTTPIRLGQGAQMLVGADTGSSVIPDYKPPFRFTGNLKKIIIDVSGETVADHEAEMKVALMKQ